MRGKPFHNLITDETESIFKTHGWQVRTEYRYRKNGTTTYFDLYAVKDSRAIACEVETTVRHAVNNALKAKTVGVVLWIIAPTRKLRCQIERKLELSGIAQNDKSTKIILLSQVNTELNSI